MRVRGGKIVVDDKGCLVKYIKEAYETILEIKAKKKADKENLVPRKLKRNSREGSRHFAQTTTTSLMRSQNARTPSPHSRTNSYRIGTTPTSKCGMRSRSNTPSGKWEANDDAQLVRIAKEIRNYMVRLQRDFGKIYKVKENKDKLVDYFEKEAVELSKSWALLEERKAEVQGRQERMKAREDLIS